METVYADSLFALNLIIDYLLLICASRLCSLPFRRWRCAAAALIGALYSVACLLPGLRFLTGGAMKIALALLMCLTAFGGEERFMRCCAAFLAVSAAFGGAVWGASMLSGVSPSGSLYVPLSLRTLVLSFALCYAGVSLTFRRASERAERSMAQLELGFQGRRVSLRALRDTGNGLYDPLSGRRVAVAEASALLPLLPEGARSALSTPGAPGMVEALSRLPGCRGRFRLVPYSAVGTAHGLLPALRPDSVRLDGRETDALLIAISPGGLSSGGDYSAIV